MSKSILPKVWFLWFPILHLGLWYLLSFLLFLAWEYILISFFYVYLIVFLKPPIEETVSSPLFILASIVLDWGIEQEWQ